jgi:hypothetical protein
MRVRSIIFCRYRFSSFIQDPFVESCNIAAIHNEKQLNQPLAGPSVIPRMGQLYWNCDSLISHTFQTFLDQTYQFTKM